MTRIPSPAFFAFVILTGVARIGMAQTFLIDEEVRRTFECGTGFVVSQACVDLEVRYQYRCTIPPGFDLCTDDSHEVRAFATVTGATNLPIGGSAGIHTEWECRTLGIIEGNCEDAGGVDRDGNKSFSCSWPGLGGAQGCQVSIIAGLGTEAGGGDHVEYGTDPSGFGIGPLWRVATDVWAGTSLSGVSASRTDWVRVVDGQIEFVEFD